jgi:hypothetical protein
MLVLLLADYIRALGLHDSFLEIKTIVRKTDHSPSNLVRSIDRLSESTEAVPNFAHCTLCAVSLLLL